MTEKAAVAVDTAEESGQVAEAPADNQGELKKLIAQRDKLKAQLRELEPLAARAKELEQAQMTEQEKLSSRLAELEPKAKAVERMEAVISALLESELEAVPEEMRDLIPGSLSLEDRLDWIRRAKAKGMFKPAAEEPAQKPPASSPAVKRPGANGTVLKRGDFDRLTPYARAEFVQKGGTVIDG